MPVCADTVLRNYHVCSRCDARDQPDNACLMADRVAHVGTEETERVDRVVAEVRMRKIDTRAHDANPNVFALQPTPPELWHLDTVE